MGYDDARVYMRERSFCITDTMKPLIVLKTVKGELSLLVDTKAVQGTCFTYVKAVWELDGDQILIEPDVVIPIAKDAVIILKVVIDMRSSDIGGHNAGEIRSTLKISHGKFEREFSEWSESTHVHPMNLGADVITYTDTYLEPGGE